MFFTEKSKKIKLKIIHFYGYITKKVFGKFNAKTNHLSMKMK